MADITFEDLIEAVQKLTPEQKSLLKRELVKPEMEPTREMLHAEFAAQRAAGAFNNVESLRNRYAKPESDDLSVEELLKQIHDDATEWEKELDEFFGDKS
jgi:hypothetical protein